MPLSSKMESNTDVWNTGEPHRYNSERKKPAQDNTVWLYLCQILEQAELM